MTLKSIKVPATNKALAPYNRIFWYILTLGKCGELHHYKHKMVTKFIIEINNNLPYAHQLRHGVPSMECGTSRDKTKRPWISNVLGRNGLQ